MGHTPEWLDKIDLEPVLSRFNFLFPAKRQLERELGMEALDLRLALLIALVVYTIPGLFLVLVTAAGRAKRAYKAKGERDNKDKEDEGWVQVIRLTNRLVASTLMFTLPPVVFAYNMKEWNPWSGGKWCTQIDRFQNILLHLQTTYYLVDTPYSLMKGDIEQIIHHIIGLGMAAGPLSLNKCGLPMMAIMFTEQGSSIWVRYTKIQRYFLPKHNALERALVHMNYYQNMWIMAPFINTPLLLRCAHQLIFSKEGIPLSPDSSTAFGVFVFLQLIYDWYWYIRLYRSYKKYQKTVRAHDADAAKKGR